MCELWFSLRLLAVPAACFPTFRFSELPLDVSGGEPGARAPVGFLISPAKKPALFLWAFARTSARQGGFLCFWSGWMSYVVEMVGIWSRETQKGLWGAQKNLQLGNSIRLGQLGFTSTQRDLHVTDRLCENKKKATTLMATPGRYGRSLRPLFQTPHRHQVLGGLGFCLFSSTKKANPFSRGKVMDVPRFPLASVSIRVVPTFAMTADLKTPQVLVTGPRYTPLVTYLRCTPHINKAACLVACLSLHTSMRTQTLSDLLWVPADFCRASISLGHKCEEPS